MSKPRRLLVGCSGGADSLALCLLLQAAQTRLDAEFRVCIVDHGLRASSAQEAKDTFDWLQRQGFHAEIRTVQATCRGNLQQFARDQRLKLLADCAVTHGASAVLLAHHRRDQAETLLDRLARGSHVVGLSAIPPLSLHHDIPFLRPLLDARPEELCRYAASHHAPIFHDPSNQQKRFRRVQLRQILRERPQLEKLALRVATAANKPAGAELAAARLLWQDHVGEPFPSILRLNIDGMAQNAPCVGIRTLGSMIRYVGGHPYPPRYAKTARLMHALLHNPFAMYTLGGVQVTRQDTALWLYPEHHLPDQVLPKDTDVQWNGHWYVSHRQETPLTLTSMRAAQWRKTFPEYAHCAFLARAFPALCSKKHFYTPYNLSNNPDISFAFQSVNAKMIDLSKTGLYFDTFYPIS